MLKEFSNYDSLRETIPLGIVGHGLDDKLEKLIGSSTETYLKISFTFFYLRSELNFSKVLFEISKQNL